MPDWVRPTTYLLSVAIILTTLGAAYQVLYAGTPAVRISSLPRVPIKNPVDTPETAVALSPIYPTPKYQMPDLSVDMVARAREASKAVGKEPQVKSQRKAKEPLQETTGNAPRDSFVVPEFRSLTPQ
jgi:hypothetical protein